MSWTSIIDQHRAVETLQRAIETDRVAHAYLFHGPDGVGKRATALAFAQVLQCTEQETTACSACQACQKIERMVHPDVHVMLPEPSDADPEDVGKRTRLLGANPYAAVDFQRRPSLDDPEKTSNKQVWIHVDRIRSELQTKLRYKPLEGRYSFVLMVDADRMNLDASNAFLKLLEEPGPQVVLVLTTTRVDSLLPTILSRCQHVRFDPLPSEAIEQALIERENIEPKRAAMLGRMADGSYTRALDLLQREDLQAHRKMALDFIRCAYVHDITKLLDHAAQMKRMGREPVKHLLQLVLSWIRDAVLYSTLSDEARLVNVDQREAIVRFCRAVEGADHQVMAAYVEDAIGLVERNVRIDLVASALAHAFFRAMRGDGPESLYEPLSAPYRRAPESRAA